MQSDDSRAPEGGIDDRPSLSIRVLRVLCADPHRTMSADQIAKEMDDGATSKQVSNILHSINYRDPHLLIQHRAATAGAASNWQASDAAQRYLDVMSESSAARRPRISQVIAEHTGDAAVRAGTRRGTNAAQDNEIRRVAREARRIAAAAGIAATAVTAGVAATCAALADEPKPASAAVVNAQADADDAEGPQDDVADREPAKAQAPAAKIDGISNEAPVATVAADGSVFLVQGARVIAYLPPATVNAIILAVAARMP